MIIGIKDTVRLFGISIVACCAVFVCTLFLNYNIDLRGIKDEIVTEAGIAMYNAQISTGKVTAVVTGGCLIATALVMLVFYIKNYIDTHGKELGILKALGYSDGSVAKHFGIFGLSVLIGCILGVVAAFLYMPTFYQAQNAEGLFPDFSPLFHPLLTFLLTGMPTVFFTLLAIIYARRKLKEPVLDLLKEKREYKGKTRKKEEVDAPFLKDLTKTTLRGKKTLVFFVAFSAFCFSAMVQMSMSMKKLSSEQFALMMIAIGLILAFMTLLLSLSSVVKGNEKTIAMMRVFGYENAVCSRAILGGYRPFAYIGFAIGTVYQYILLKAVVTIVFADIENVPEYSFDVKAFFITLAAFIIVYELILYFYSLRIKKSSIKSIMSE